MERMTQKSLSLTPAQWDDLKKLADWRDELQSELLRRYIRRGISADLKRLEKSK